MATTAITKITLPHTNAGYNLTDSASFTTMATGSGNGVTFSYSASDIVVMKNTTGGTATYTLKIPTIGALSAFGATVTNPTNTVAAGKTELMRLDPVFQDSSGLVTIECDVAGSILVLTP
jgi:hypothetical protein